MNLERQKIKRYKVVNAISRYSIVIPGTSKYAIQYLPETEVFALPYTLGIMCFTQYIYAKSFISRHWSYKGIIVPVIPLGKGKFPHELAKPTKLHQYYSGVPHVKVWGTSSMKIPQGTICYPGVYVLE